ncbi:hypothetical protein SUGI_0647780 [Cryptomeria japonica]|uniref:dirigent protein 11-like n=1 Tax=Cryptomeria japonica TaxID=3369 RepID=UPI00241481D6|nr:dirigent protein 11-like [Cryptomeria japonica]GLJ32176.1 hypothetical protein SUGI_0647780 [Cryptomeria japonica]
MASKCSVLLLFTLISVLSCGALAGARKENLVFYAHEISQGPNRTTLTIAGVNGSSSVLSAFGTVSVVDHAVTEGPNATSKILGKFQGLVATTDFSRSNFHLIFSVVFENEKYNGSSLEMHGTIRSLEPHLELSVSGGTGHFRFVTGYAVVEILSAVAGFIDYKFNVTLRSY